MFIARSTQITKFMGPTWGPPGSCRPQMGPMLAPWTLLSGCIHCPLLIFVRYDSSRFYPRLSRILNLQQNITTSGLKKRAKRQLWKIHWINRIVSPWAAHKSDGKDNWLREHLFYFSEVMSKWHWSCRALTKSLSKINLPVSNTDPSPISNFTQHRWRFILNMTNCRVFQ